MTGAESRADNDLNDETRGGAMRKDLKILNAD
jgi:hypothetical protein